MTHLRSIACSFLAATAAHFLCLPAGGQDANLAQFDPSNVYFQAWLTAREAEKDEKAGNFLDAFDKYDKAKKLFDSVALYNPDWKTDLVKDRQKITAEAMVAIKARARGEQQTAEKKTKDLVEGPSPPAPRPKLEVPRLTEDKRRQVDALQRQILQYRNELKKARSDRDANAVRLRSTLKELESQRDRMARAPVASQLEELNQRIDKVVQERSAMALALRQSRAEQHDTLAQLETAKAEAGAAKERAQELDDMVKAQQTAANRAVEGLRRQLKEMKEKAVEKDKKFATLQARNAQLERQLQEARAEILDLREERDSLLVERDQMAALLKLNESERVRILIKQNMDLGRDLKIARDRLQELLADNNSTKDELLNARVELTATKARIIELQKESASQASRLAALEIRLREAGKELDADLKNPALDRRTREEMEMLRGIISRQLRVQEHRQLAKAAVMEEVKRIGLQDSNLVGELDAFFGQELKLTEEESKLIKDYQVDQDFIFADRPNQREVVNAAQDLQQSISIKEMLARRAYSNERFLAAREVFESILSEHPGHVPTILNLGVVHIKIDELDLAIAAFNDALVIRGDNLPFAQFMLGVCYYRFNDLQRARVYLAKAIDQDPNNAQAHVFLGSVAGNGNQFDAAEHHFKEAIRIDPTLTEPYYNLAKIYQLRGSKLEALKYYRQALENGADLDLELERKLSG